MSPHVTIKRKRTDVQVCYNFRLLSHAFGRTDHIYTSVVELIVEVKTLHTAKYKPDLLSTFPRDITDPGLFLVNLPI